MTAGTADPGIRQYRFATGGDVEHRDRLLLTLC